MSTSGPTGVLITDLHFDPLYNFTPTTHYMHIVEELYAADVATWDEILTKAGTPFNERGDDTSYPMLISAIDYAASLQPSGLVLCTGDLLRHDFKDAFDAFQTNLDFALFAAKTAVFVVQKLQAAFKVPVIVALGNNDTTFQHYVVPPNNILFAELACAIKVVDQLNAAAKAVYREGAYYSILNPCVPKQTLIVLNTVFWSPKYRVADPPREMDDKEPGETEMLWLKDQLQRVRDTGHGQRAALVMHIPPGYDVPDQKPMWTSAFEQDFIDLMAEYGEMIDIAFAGHTHMDDFRIISVAGHHGLTRIPVRLTPGISSQFSNNPGLSSFAYQDGAGTVQDVASYYFNLAVPISDIAQSWHPEYHFSQAYGYDAYNATTLLSLATRLREKGSTFEDFQRFYYSSATDVPPTPKGFPPLSKDTAQLYLCAQTNLTSTAYSVCTAVLTDTR